MDLRKVKADLSGFDRKSVTSINKVTMGKAGFALDLGDGSERAEYVGQDQVIQTLGRPVRRISIMFTYYPNNPEWPARSSEAYPDMEVTGQWGYPYDDYFPYKGGLNGDKDSEVFRQMRDIRRHGEDVTLTLTCDCSITEEQMRAIAEDLKPFGRLRLRINHECNGNWFKHNQLYSYDEIAEFFVRFSKIVKEIAPNVDTVFCAGIITDEGTLEKEESFTKCYKAADLWSADKYFTLHYGWPFNVAEKGGLSKTYALTPVDDMYEKFEKAAERMYEITGDKEKKLVMSELNADMDVTGPFLQGEPFKRLLEMVKEKKPHWFEGIAYYQFRDRGGLGLELEDPNDSSVGHPLPMLDEFKGFLNDDHFMPAQTAGEKISEDAEVPMRYGASDDADGIEYTVHLDGQPVFFEIAAGKNDNLMIDVDGKWFYKSAGVEVINVIEAFFDRNKNKEPRDIKIRFYAPPADGENPNTGAADWDTEYRTVIKELPMFRMRYEAVDTVC